MDNKANLVAIVKKIGMPSELETELLKKIESQETVDSHFVGEIAEELKNISEYLKTLAGVEADVAETVLQEVDRFGDQLDQVNQLEENLKQQFASPQSTSPAPAAE